ncbi:MAG: DNA-binding protein [Aliidongia sp.]
MMTSRCALSAALTFDQEPAGRPIPTDPNALLFTAEAAAVLGLSARTLEALRLKGGGPMFVQLARNAVRYRRGRLDEWVSARERRSTSDPGGTAVEAGLRRSTSDRGAA